MSVHVNIQYIFIMSYGPNYLLSKCRITLGGPLGVLNIEYGIWGIGMGFRRSSIGY